MCQGEYESLKAIYETVPEFCPKPHAWGECAGSDRGTCFLLTKYREVAYKVRTAHILASTS